MLANSNVVAFVPTRNAAVARNFYSDVLGLTFVTDDQFAIVMEANGTQVRIVRVGSSTLRRTRFLVGLWKISSRR